MKLMDPEHFPDLINISNQSPDINHTPKSTESMNGIFLTSGWKCRSGSFMQQALMIPDAMIDRVAEIEKKHQGILNIEKGVKELQELWGQFGALIDEQQEQLDNIEHNVEQTLNYVQKGQNELIKA